MRITHAVAIIIATSLPAFADDPVCPMHAQHAAAAKADTHSPYTANAANAVKALSPETLKAYRKGTGMGLAIPAELNGYPGPRHILDLADQLSLSAEQRKRIEAIYAPMHDQAVRLGSEIIDLETKLDTAFAQKTITPESLQATTAEIAALQGRLRYVHLSAHVAAKSVLTAEQTAAYAKLRGYDGMSGGEHEHHHHAE